jgi:hypothetical protein
VPPKPTNPLNLITSASATSVRRLPEIGGHSRSSFEEPLRSFGSLHVQASATRALPPRQHIKAVRRPARQPRHRLHLLAEVVG